MNLVEKDALLGAFEYGSVDLYLTELPATPWNEHTLSVIELIRLTEERQAPELWSMLSQHFTSANAKIRFVALDVLTHIGPHENSDPAVYALFAPSMAKILELSDDSDLDVRKGVATFLGLRPSLQGSHESLVIPLLNDRASAVRAKMLEWLTDAPWSSSVTDTVMARLEDVDAEVRKAAADKVSSHPRFCEPDSTCDPKLTKLFLRLINKYSLIEQAALVRGLAKIARRDDLQVRDVLQRMLAHSDGEMRGAAAGSLIFLVPDEKTIDMVSAVASDRSFDAQFGLVLALDRLRMPRNSRFYGMMETFLRGVDSRILTRSLGVVVFNENEQVDRIPDNVLEAVTVLLGHESRYVRIGAQEVLRQQIKNLSQPLRRKVRDIDPDFFRELVDQQPQMNQDLLDHRRVFNGCDNTHGATTLGTNLHINGKHPLEHPSPESLADRS